MHGNRRAQLFALDLMLAMIPLTIVIGLSATAMAGVTTQMQEYMYGYSLQRITLDAADVLIKTPGDPADWENNTVTLNTLGLSLNISGTTTNNLLDLEKILTLNSSVGDTAVEDSLGFLSGGNNIRISLYVNLDEDDITNISNEDVNRFLDIGRYQENGAWTTTNNSALIDNNILNSRDIYVQNRLGFIGDPSYGGESISSMQNFSRSALNSSGWDPINGTFTIADLSDNFDYYFLINYTEGSPSGTPNSFKDILVNDVELTTVYSYPSMTLKSENYQIESGDSGIWIPVTFSLLAETNNITIQMTGNPDLGLIGTLVVLPKDIPLNEIPDWVDFYLKFQYKNVLARIVIWK